MTCLIRLKPSNHRQSRKKISWRNSSWISLSGVEGDDSRVLFPGTLSGFRSQWYVPGVRNRKVRRRSAKAFPCQARLLPRRRPRISMKCQAWLFRRIRALKCRFWLPREECNLMERSCLSAGTDQKCLIALHPLTSI